MTNADIKRLSLVLAVQAEIDGMKAQNIQQSILGYSMSYNDQHFFDKAEELRTLAAKHDDQL